MLLLFALVVGVVVWLATGAADRVRLAVDTGGCWDRHRRRSGHAAWVVVIVAGYRMLAAPGTTRGRHVLGSVVVLLLVVAVALPPSTWARCLAQRGLVDGVFAEDRESATVEETPDPFGDQERVNVLLLGGDGGEGRDGVRTDTVIVASIATATGETTLFSLPRNLEDLPSRPTARWPSSTPTGSTPARESLLNAVYRNGPAEHPDVLGRTDDPGRTSSSSASARPSASTSTTSSWSTSTGSAAGRRPRRHHGERQLLRAGRRDPDSRIAARRLHRAGPNQHLDGAGARLRPRAVRAHRLRPHGPPALHDRRDRRRGRPVTLLRSYQELAATTRDIVSTDIPRSALDDFVDLAFLVKDASIRSVVFDATLIDPAYPDYDVMRRIVQEAIDPAPAAEETPETTRADVRRSDEGRGPGRPAAPEDPAADVGDACAYDRAQAEEALAAGSRPRAAAEPTATCWRS